jgi:hypothetical protein
MEGILMSDQIQFETTTCYYSKRTGRLRYLKPLPVQGCNVLLGTLQEEWIDQVGTIHWEDIPTVYEGEEK